MKGEHHERDSDPASFCRPDHLRTPGNRIRYKAAAAINASTAEKIKNETIKRICCEITDAVADAVAAMNQTYVNDLKKTGSFDKAAQAKALNGAISAAIKSLSSDALDYIKRISGGDTAGYLTTRIQAQIDHNKTAKLRSSNATHKPHLRAYESPASSNTLEAGLFFLPKNNRVSQNSLLTYKPKRFIIKA